MQKRSSIPELLFVQLRKYLDSTRVEYRLWRDRREELKNDESMGVWALLHRDLTTSPFPLQSPDPWELIEYDTYRNIFQKEPDGGEGE